MAYGELYVRATLYVLLSAYVPPRYARIQRGLRARHTTTYKARRSRTAELVESFVLPRITRTMHANRNGFTLLFSSQRCSKHRAEPLRYTRR